MRTRRTGKLVTLCAVIAVFVAVIVIAAVVHAGSGGGKLARTSSLSASSSQGPTPSPSTVAGDWIRYVSPEGGFAIEAPVPPDAFVEGGDHRTVFQVIGGVDAVDWSDVPDVGASEEAILTSYVKREFDFLTGEIHDRRKLSLDGHPGVSYRTTAGNGAVALVHVYVVGTRIYSVVGHPPSHPTPSELRDAERFVDSFELTGG